MKKILFILPLLILISCDEIKDLIFSEDNEDNFTVFPLPIEFPLDRKYAWKYEYVSYDGIHELTNASDEGTTYFDTLHVFPNTGHGDAFYWWSSYARFETPYRNLVMNEGDNFIHIANYYIEDDSSFFFEKPSTFISVSIPKIWLTEILMSGTNSFKFAILSTFLSLSVLNDCTPKLLFLVYLQIPYYQSFYQGEIFLQGF